MIKSRWFSLQSKMPKNILNFTIQYLNNSFLTRKQNETNGISHNPKTALSVTYQKHFFLL